MNRSALVLLDLDKDIRDWEDYMDVAINTFGGLSNAPSFSSSVNGDWLLELIELEIIVDYRFIPLVDLFYMVSKWSKRDRVNLLESIACDLSQVYNETWSGSDE